MRSTAIEIIGIGMGYDALCSKTSLARFGIGIGIGSRELASGIDAESDIDIDAAIGTDRSKIAINTTYKRVEIMLSAEYAIKHCGCSRTAFTRCLLAIPCTHHWNTVLLYCAGQLFENIRNSFWTANRSTLAETSGNRASSTNGTVRQT